MARSAQDTIKKRISQAPIHVAAVKEPQDAAIGNGVGIM